MRLLTDPRMLMLMLVACRGSPPPPVPVVASPWDIRQLAGEWVGEYGSAATGRAGSIVFTLDSAEDHAHGDVIMGPTNRAWLGFESPGTRPPPEASEGQVLSIRFVRAAGDRVSGVLEPYTDPSCDCRVRTEFVGRVAADTISGRYEIRSLSGGPPRAGEWRVVRRSR